MTFASERDERAVAPNERVQGDMNKRTVAGAVLGVLASALPLTLATTAGADAADDAYAAVNRYRAQSGLAPVSSNAAFLDGVRAHSCWMVANDTISHGERPDTFAYTAAGDQAGKRSNLIVSSHEMSSQDAVDLWMTGPYHAIGILRPGLRSTAYGTCGDEAGTWRHGASLDIISGLDSLVAISEPITFPGNGATVHVNSFIAETPNPLDNCGYASAGLPVFVMLPEAPGAVTAVISGPAGPIESCTVTPDTDITEGAPILRGENAVIVIPRQPLANGNYNVSIQTSSRSVQWSFGVDDKLDPSTLPTAPAPAPKPAPAEGVSPQPSPFGACQAQAQAVFEFAELAKVVADRVMRDHEALTAAIPTGSAPAELVASAKQNNSDWKWVVAQVRASNKAISVKYNRGGTVSVRCGKTRATISGESAFFLNAAKTESASLVRRMKPYAAKFNRQVRQFG